MTTNDIKARLFDIEAGLKAIEAKVLSFKSGIIELSYELRDNTTLFDTGLTIARIQKVSGECAEAIQKHEALSKEKADLLEELKRRA